MNSIWIYIYICYIYIGNWHWAEKSVLYMMCLPSLACLKNQRATVSVLTSLLFGLGLGDLSLVSLWAMSCALYPIPSIAVADQITFHQGHFQWKRWIWVKKIWEGRLNIWCTPILINWREKLINQGLSIMYFLVLSFDKFTLSVHVVPSNSLCSCHFYYSYIQNQIVIITSN